jgi:hypothetical protein
MRFPVFSRRSNPSVDPPIVRKHMRYLELQVAEFLADWVDPSDKRKGIIAREFLRSGARALPPDPVELNNLALPRVELPGLRYVPPPTDPQPRLASVKAGWDWSCELAAQ